MWINNHWYTESEIKDLLYVKDKRIKELTKALGEKFEACDEVEQAYREGYAEGLKKAEDTTDRHWNECRQISTYEAENREMKEKLEQIKKLRAIRETLINSEG